MSEWFWIQTGLRWFRFSRWFHALLRDSALRYGRTDEAEVHESHRKKADWALGLCLAKDLSRSMNKVLNKTK